MIAAEQRERLIKVRSEGMLQLYRAIADLAGAVPVDDDRGTPTMLALAAARDVDLDLEEILQRDEWAAESATAKGTVSS